MDLVGDCGANPIDRSAALIVRLTIEGRSEHFVLAALREIHQVWTLMMVRRSMHAVYAAQEVHRNGQIVTGKAVRVELKKRNESGGGQTYFVPVVKCVKEVLGEVVRPLKPGCANDPVPETMQGRSFYFKMDSFLLGAITATLISVFVVVSIVIILSYLHG